MIFLTSCPICLGSNYSDFITCKDHTTSGEEFTIRKCDGCGLTFTDPRPDEASIGKYYLSQSYISHTGGQKKFLDKIYLIARRFALHQKRKIIEKNSRGNSILDYGCGTGEFLKEMKKSGWNIAGIEPSEIANVKATESTKTKIYSKISELERKDFQVVTLWHVLEHIHDLNGTIDKLKEVMTSSSTLIIAVPNLESYDARYYKSFWAGYDVPRHLWHFNKKNLIHLLKNHGFELTQIIPMHLDSFYVSLLSESYTDPKKWKIFNLFSAFWIGLVSNWKARKSMNYSSLIYIAKKR